jgi:hypothetical protein
VKYTFCCQHSISALYDGGNKLAEIAAGVFSTTEEKLGLFLKGYAGVKLLSETPDKAPAPINAGQYGLAPDIPLVINGGFSGGGAMAIKGKK